MATKKTTHTGFRNDKLFCFNCGQSLDLQLPQPVAMAAEVMKAFAKVHKDCKPAWKAPEPNMNLSVQDRASFWIQHGEQGTSSKTIFKYLNGYCPNFRTESHPLDPDDFRRCYLLLKTIPEWILRLDEMRKVSPVWNKLVDNWDTLTKMLETAMSRPKKEAPEMYELMRKIGC